MNSNNNNNINIKKRATLFIAAIIFTASAIFSGKALIGNSNSASSIVSSMPANTSLSVTFLDVGQGNCVIVQSKGHYMVIDGGNNEYSSKVISYLHNLGVTTIDYVIISHYDSDHLSGLIGIFKNYSVTNILSPDYTVDTKIYNSYTTMINQKNLTPVHPNIGDEYSLGDASFQIVAPVTYSYADENNNSIGIKLTDGNHSFLFLGDAESESETDIIKTGIELSCDVYMVSHHGSSNSSTNHFLDIIQPNYAIISVGPNDYGHPNDQVLNRLNSHSATTYRTDKSGTIIAYSGKDFLNWSFTNPVEYTQAETDHTDVSYIGNKNSHKFHLPSCTNLPIKNNQIYFGTREDAINANYSPCGVCNP